MSLRASIALVLWTALVFVAAYILVREVTDWRFPSPKTYDPGPAVYQPVPFPIDTYPFCMGRDSCKTIVPKPAGYQRWSLREGTWSNDKVVR
jgi:hypothetical protein